MYLKDFFNEYYKNLELLFDRDSGGTFEIYIRRVSCPDDPVCISISSGSSLDIFFAVFLIEGTVWYDARISSFTFIPDHKLTILV